MRLFRHVKQILSLIIGVPLLILGVVLIPLPGPGIVICFVALAILAQGFDWAKKYYEKAKTLLLQIYKTSEKRADVFEKSMNKKWDARQSRRRNQDK